jgi:hypothetical protein
MRIFKPSKLFKCILQKTKIVFSEFYHDNSPTGSIKTKLNLYNISYRMSQFLFCPGKFFNSGNDQSNIFVVLVYMINKEVKVIKRLKKVFQ